MPRLVNPDLMVLRLGSLPDAAGRYPLMEQEFGPLLRGRAHDTREPDVPVSLRWAIHPLLGFPRVPFEVWRRTRTEEPTAAVLGPAAPVSPATVLLPNEVIEIRFDTSPGPGGLTVQALSRDGRVLPGQRLQFAAPQGGRFRAPGIAGLLLTGAGSIGGIGAIVQADWANLSDWVRIEVVGLPFDPAQLPVAVYDPGSQGWDPPGLTGPDAALIRLGVAQLLQLDPPAPGGALTAPPWPFPDPARFLDVLRKGPLADIAQCLASSDDTDPRALQVLHELTRSLTGIHQPGQAPGDPADLALATTAYIALAVHDGPVAVGLGFGTVDVPQIGPTWTPKDAMPPGTELGRDEYLVSAPFTNLFGTFELAAIGHRAAPPPALVGVTAEQTFANRAMSRDDAESAAVRLSWSPPPDQIGAALLVGRPPAPTTLINTPRPGASGGFQPYLTEHLIAADGNPSTGARPGITLPEEPVPLSSTAVTSYAVAPLDIHGRWGPWHLTSHTVAARAVQPPGLGQVSVEFPAVLNSPGPVASGCALTVEVSWDWADRSPDRIEVSGAYFPVASPVVTPPTTVSGFEVSFPAVGFGVPITIAFGSSGIPSIAAPSAGSPPDVVWFLQSASVVEIIEAGVAPGPPPPDAAGAQVRRYRLKVQGLSMSFSTVDEVGYAVSARAAEHVRPAALSAETGPRVTSVANPFPAPPPTMPNVAVLWTAQPDASGRARTVLNWPDVPGASGYIVWEATETALSYAVGGSAVTGAMRLRATDLKARVAAAHDASLSAFSRVNERPTTATSIELVLPGSADTLYAYRVSSITAQNMESARSADIVLVGVPHRDVPGTPRMEASVSSANETVTLIVVPGSGLTPAGLRVFRVRRESLADQVGTMGPPVLSATTAGMATFTLPALSVLPGSVPEFGWQLTDAVRASWVPYYYRCVTVGQDAPDDGVRAGESPPSGVVCVLLPPPAPPLVSGATRTDGPAGTLLRLLTDVPYLPTPAGAGQLVVASVLGGTRTVLATVPSALITIGPPLASNGRLVGTVSATRGPAAAGVCDLTVLLPTPSGSILLTATDPLGRSTTVELG